MSSESENNLTTKEEDFKTISTNTKDPDRGCSNKNYIELIGCHKFSVFFVDRTICRLLVSQVQEVQEVEKYNDDNIISTAPSTPPNEQTPPKSQTQTSTPPKVDSPIRRSFFSSFFW